MEDMKNNVENIDESKIIESETNIQENEKIETKGLKLKKSTKEKLNILQSKYGDAESMISALLSQHEAFNIENSDKYSDRKAEIEKFNYLMESIKSSFLNSLDMATFLEEKYAAKLAEEIKHKDKIISVLQNENISLKSDIKDIEKECEKKGEELNAVKDSFSRVNLALTTMERELSEKSEVIQNSQKHINTLTSISQDLESSKIENKQLNDELKELKDILNSKSYIEKECENYKQDISRLQKENEGYKAEIVSYRSEVNELNIKIHNIISSSSNEINKIKDDCNNKLLTLEAEKNKSIMDYNSIIAELKDSIYKLQLDLLKKDN